MAVRKMILFDVGGFNPDGFGDHSLIRYRGDGESGLARKIHEAGHSVWYSPEAFLEHRVPDSRMTLEYISRRAENSGIEAIYRFYRYRLHYNPTIVLFGLKYAAKAIYHWALKWTNLRKSPAWFRHYAASIQHFHSVAQCLRLICSKELRMHTKMPTYLK